MSEWLTQKEICWKLSREKKTQYFTWHKFIKGITDGGRGLLASHLNPDRIVIRKGDMYKIEQADKLINKLKEKEDE